MVKDLCSNFISSQYFTADVYAFAPLHQLFDDGLDTFGLKEHIQTKSNLVAYLGLMRTTYFSS